MGNLLIARQTRKNSVPDTLGQVSFTRSFLPRDTLGARDGQLPWLGIYLVFSLIVNPFFLNLAFLLISLISLITKPVVLLVVCSNKSLPQTDRRFGRRRIYYRQISKIEFEDQPDVAYY